MPRLWIFLITVSTSIAAYADRLEGTVIRVTSGDRLVLKETETKKRHNLELAGIMAPIKGQPYFDSSLAALHKLVRKKTVIFDWDKVAERCKQRPSTCPKIGRLLVDSKDINLEQVKKGMAWHDIRHMDEQTTPDRTLYNEAESEARLHRVGLWKMKKPVAPWQFKPAAAPPVAPAP